MTWSAAQYSKFEAERNRPIRDLLSVLPIDGIGRIVDLGCGPGNSTELVRQRYPQANIVGIDSSPDMIAAARERLPSVRFEVADIAAWSEPADLLFANAALQWVPDYERLLPELVDRLVAGGHLAVQIPDNWDEPAHRLMREVAADGPWQNKLVGAERIHANRHSPEWYYRLLRPLTQRLDLWRTTYFHELSGGTAGVIEWFKGSALRPLLARLDAGEQAAFLSRYADALATAYPVQNGGAVLLPFPRLFFVAGE